MLAGAGMAAVVSFHACCRFFSAHAWDADRLGLALARLIVTRLLDADAPIEVVVDDTLFRRWGRRVFGAYWTHDGSAQDPNALGRGNRWIIVGIVVELPFRSHPVCLPVCLLWRGKGPSGAAGWRYDCSAAAVSGTNHPRRGRRRLHGKVLLVENTTFTTGCRSTPCCTRRAAAHRQTRRPAEGPAVGHPAELATTPTAPGQVSRYGHAIPSSRRDRRPLVRRVGTSRSRRAGPRPAATRSWHCHHRPPQRRERVVARYAHRWPIETAIAAGKQLLGIGQARNRLRRAVERTVPFEFIVYSLVIIWYALHGHHRDDSTPSTQLVRPGRLA